MSLTGQHPASGLLKNYFKPAVQGTSATLDSVGKDKNTPPADDESVMDSASEYAMTDIALKVAAAMQEFVETDDLDEGEGLGDRLFSLLVGVADADMDGEVSDAEQELFASVQETAWDYLAAKGVPDGDIDVLLNEWDNDVAMRVQELLADRLPDGEDASADDINAFAFGDGAEESALDAVYKMKVAIKGGKKVRIKKRISGTVRLSAKQKVAVRKMLRKSHSAMATMKRMKSMKIRRKAGL